MEGIHGEAQRIHRGCGGGAMCVEGMEGCIGPQRGAEGTEKGTEF